MFRVCAEAASLGNRRHAKSISKESSMHNFYTNVNKWAAIGRKREDRAGLTLALSTFQLEGTCMARWLGYLEAKSCSRHTSGVEESREGQGGEIQLGHEFAVFDGHSKADALVAHRNRTLIFIKTISNTDTVNDIFEFSHVSHSTIKI